MNADERSPTTLPNDRDGRFWLVLTYALHIAFSVAIAIGALLPDLLESGPLSGAARIQVGILYLGIPISAALVSIRARKLDPLLWVLSFVAILMVGRFADPILLGRSLPDFSGTLPVFYRALCFGTVVHAVFWKRNSRKSVQAK